MSEYKTCKDLDIQTISERIKIARRAMRGRIENGVVKTDSNPANKPFSQRMLLDYIAQKGLPHFSRNVLSRLESDADMKVLKAISLGHWLALCKVFGVSLGWLLGEYDEAETIDRLYISQQTGLSNEAIKVLQERNQRLCISEYGFSAEEALYVINNLLCHETMLCQNVLLYMKEYDVYRQLEETTSDSVEKEKCRKRKDLSYYMAADGLHDIMKASYDAKYPETKRKKK